MGAGWKPAEVLMAGRYDYRVMRQDFQTATGCTFLYSVFWVEYHDNGTLAAWGQSPAYPLGQTGVSLMETIRKYNQAICKPVLDFVTGREVEAPILGRGLERAGAT